MINNNIPEIPIKYDFILTEIFHLKSNLLKIIFFDTSFYQSKQISSYGKVMRYENLKNTIRVVFFFKSFLFFI